MLTLDYPSKHQVTCDTAVAFVREDVCRGVLWEPYSSMAGSDTNADLKQKFNSAVAGLCAREIRAGKKENKPIRHVHKGRSR